MIDEKVKQSLKEKRNEWNARNRVKERGRQRNESISINLCEWGRGRPRYQLDAVIKTFSNYYWGVPIRRASMSISGEDSYLPYQAQTLFELHIN